MKLKKVKKTEQKSRLRKRETKVIKFEDAVKDGTMRRVTDPEEARELIAKSRTRDFTCGGRGGNSFKYADTVYSEV